METFTETITDADYPAPPSELDYLRIRVGEMAAEIERLHESPRITEQNALEIATQFFYWWHNQPGTNTMQGFGEWIKCDGRTLLQKLNAEKQLVKK